MGPNLYAYCGNDSINYIDAYGLSGEGVGGYGGQGFWLPGNGWGGAGSGIDWGKIRRDRPDPQPGARQINGGCNKNSGSYLKNRELHKGPKPGKALGNKGWPPLREGKGWKPPINADYEPSNWWKDFLDNVSDFLDGMGDSINMGK